MTRALLLLLAAPLLAAAPVQRGLTLQVPDKRGMDLPVPPKPPAEAPATSYGPAPLPDRDLDLPGRVGDDRATTVSPTLFNRRDTYRGEGFSKGSSADAEQDRRARPGAGFKLKMPLSPN